MLSDLIEAIVSNRWVIGFGTIGFFTVKGLAWLVIPALMLRWRNKILEKKA